MDSNTDSDISDNFDPSISQSSRSRNTLDTKDISYLRNTLDISYLRNTLDVTEIDSDISLDINITHLGYFQTKTIKNGKVYTKTDKQLMLEFTVTGTNKDQCANIVAQEMQKYLDPCNVIVTVEPPWMIFNYALKLTDKKSKKRWGPNLDFYNTKRIRGKPQMTLSCKLFCPVD